MGKGGGRDICLESVTIIPSRDDSDFIKGGSNRCRKVR